MTGLCRKEYLELIPPTEDDSRSAQVRIFDALAKLKEPIQFSVKSLRQLSAICQTADWKITVSLSWDGSRWLITNLEAGDTTSVLYGLAVDLGSTTVVLQLVDCHTGKLLTQESVRNHQRDKGLEILSRIFYTKDRPDHLEELRQLTLKSILEGMETIKNRTNIDVYQCGAMVISGNNAMIHFLTGLDPLPIFASPYAVWANQLGFCPASDLELPLSCPVYVVPARANYLGGDIISGLMDVDIQEKEGIQAFFDVGTNGELVIGNRDFLLCGAGAAGPALEGEAVRTGMRAAKGAVTQVRLNHGEFSLTVLGNVPPAGICGSGIVDLLAELYLNGWVDNRGKLMPEMSDKIVWQPDEEEYAVCYGPKLWFYETDIQEFLKAKAAASTMVQILLQQIGLTVDDVENFYMAGAFGIHIHKESAVAIGMYPDIPPERIHQAGNTSLNGAVKLLLNRSLIEKIPDLLSRMTYVQFGAVENFLHEMVAATAIPHTNLEAYPTIEAARKLRMTENAAAKTSD